VNSRRIYTPTVSPFCYFSIHPLSATERKDREEERGKNLNDVLRIDVFEEEERNRRPKRRTEMNEIKGVLREKKRLRIDGLPKEIQPK